MSIFDRAKELKEKATGKMSGDKPESKGHGMVEQAREKAEELGEQAKEGMDKLRPDS